MEAMIFGFCLLTSDVNAFLLLSNKKSGFALGFSLLSLALTGVTVYFWRRLLIASGRDPALLGLRHSPAVPVILGLLALAALLGLILAVRQLILGRKREK